MLFLWVSFLNEAVFSYLVIPPPLKLLLQLFHHLCGHFSWSPNILTFSFLLIRGFQSHDPQVWSGTDYECSFSIQAPKNNAHHYIQTVVFSSFSSSLIYLFIFTKARKRLHHGCAAEKSGAMQGWCSSVGWAGRPVFLLSFSPTFPV